MKPYLYLSGLKKIAKKIKGNENVHVGIRPYGFHGGNVLSLIVYPYLLCKELEKLGKKPKLKFIVSINDYEQDELDGPDIRRYPFNIYPKNTSLQFTRDDSGKKYTADHWQPIIEKSFNNSILKSFPNIKIEFIRNSSLKNHKHFKSLLLETIKNPKKQSQIFAKYSGKEVLRDPIKYAGVVCPKCKKTHGDTSVIKNKIMWICSSCGYKKIDDYKNFDYWWHHKAMLVSRLKIFKTQITMSGGDHYSEGDFNIRRKLMKIYFEKINEPLMLFCPTLISDDGQKMSKSRRNTHYINAKKLAEICENNFDSEIIIRKDLIEKIKNEKDYNCIF